MMEQYLAIKQQHPDKIVWFQVGDFYEMFFDDAVLAAREMDIALTTRDTNKENPIPMAGVPIHAAETYLNRLLAKNYKVAICDQVEDPALARGLVRREVTRIITPGTVTDSEMLEEGRNNYLAALVQSGESGFGLAAVDVSTGDFSATETRGPKAWEDILDELRRLQPAEVISSSPDLLEQLKPSLLGKNRIQLEKVEPLEMGEVRRLIDQQWGEEFWEEANLSGYPLAAEAAAAILTYLRELQHPLGSHFHPLELYFAGKHMIIDCTTNRNLELTQTLREGDRQRSLLGLLDSCMTSMGRRLLRRWVEQPLVNIEAILERQEAVAELHRRPLLRKELRRLLRDFIDLERFCSRLCYQRVNARDLVGLKRALLLLPSLKKALAEAEALQLTEIAGAIPSFADLVEVIHNCLVEDPPLSLKEGGLIREGYHPEVDRYRSISRDGSRWLLELEQRERERTGIKTLKIGYNRNFGYYIEVTRSNLGQVPPDYYRRQTLVNAERFTTDELKEIEDQITGARDRLVQLEYELFEELRQRVAGHTNDLQQTAHLLARLDCLQSLAEVAERYRYCRPQITAGNTLHIEKGRHPVVERLSGERFVPNDLHMDENNYIAIITGPNMAGKSTYCRSIALICLMGQMGGFVPAKKAVLPVLDRIFARVGASDDLSRGYSTFMVEMQETATILAEASPRSLVVLDEIGRGTSTYDGMSIARSVLEYIATSIKAKTLFSTHYHELTRLEGELKGIKNYTMAVREKGKEVIFLRQVVPGHSDKSYGINVARLAGLPLEVILRAEAILAEMETAAAKEKQLSLLPFTSCLPAVRSREKELVDEIINLDLNRTSPLEALQILFRLQKKALENGEERD
ncbi:MAG: DNA mismatch repair protein MutS [Firmicutes bacterium]|jgi:DNA mismatch repair protein MutS|nr:DNA mismatch repair protein MutS [Bacillota bacterium]